MIPSKVVIGMHMESGDRLGVKHCGYRGALAERFSLQEQSVRVVDEAVEDSVRDGRVPDHLVPVLDRQLAGDDGGASPVPVVDDLEKVAALLAGQRRQSPIVEDQQLHPAQRLQQPSIPTIAARESERFK